MSKNILAAMMLAVVTALSFSACADRAQHQGYLTFEDSLGYTVTLAKKPTRAAVLFSSFADVYTTAGGKVEITVGESVERGFADDTAVLVDGGAGKKINREALVAAKPDFVICSADIPAQTAEASFLRSIGIAAACFRVDTFEDYLKMLKNCTDVTGETDNYSIYGTQVKARVKELKKVKFDEKILFIRSGSTASSAKAKTARENFVCAMLQELGTTNIADRAPSIADGLSVEEVLTQNPKRIFVSTMGNEAAAKKYMEGLFASDGWRTLDAVKSGRTYFLPKELFQFKPNARWAEAYEYLIGLFSE